MIGDVFLFRLCQQIVPRLVEAGNDPHPKVKESVRAAMSDISSVIRNPEILRLSPILLNALADPGDFNFSLFQFSF